MRYCVVSVVLPRVLRSALCAARKPRASFVPVVLSASGGYGKHANALFTRIASLLAEKSKEPYGQVISLLRCRLGFALVRCGAMCLRGSRSMFAPAMPESPAVLVAAEARIQ
eukprot:scpid105885/ scgid19975/ 